jgi:cytochrome c
MNLKKALPIAAALIVSAGVAHAEGDPAKGKKVFNKCKACHMVGEGAKKRVGPPLNNVIGAKAGSQEDYNYSKAMKEAGENGLVWNDENLDAYLEKPKDVVPKGKMAFPGLKKESDRANVIAYLKQFTKAQ